MAEHPFVDQGIEAAARKACPRGHHNSDDWLERITDIHPDEGQTLCDLHLMPNLKRIVLEHWEVTHEDVAFISAHPALCGLSLIDCSFEQPVDLSALTNVKEIEMKDLKDFDLRLLLPLHSLTALSANQCTFTHLPALSRQTQLTKLAFCDCNLEDISPLAPLTNLTSLNLYRNGISDVSALSGMTGLRDLDLSRNSISDIGALSGMTGLRDLNLFWNSIADVGALAGMIGLSKLDLSSNRITDISALSGMTALRSLDLGYNKITDIHALSRMSDLRALDLSWNSVTDAAPILNMKSLRSLKMNADHLRDMHVLQQKPFSKLGIRIPDVPQTEPEAVRAERLRKKLPRVKKLCDVHPRAHFCRSAVLLRLEDGMGRIALRRYQASKSPDQCDLFFDDQLLIHGDVESGTCSAHLYAGYGNILKDDVYQAVRDRLNADFESIDASLPALAPLLGLFSSGTYMIADFDLFPIQRDHPRPTHFWEAPDYDPYIQFFYGAFNCDISSDAPRYLFPTQPARCMNPAQTDAYIARLRKNDQSLRTIAFYLNGSVALVLDGHHKAAAAAALGKPARTLVIFSVEDDKDLLAAVKQGKRIFLHNVSRYLVQGGPMLLCDSDGEHLCSVTSLQSMTRKRLYLPLEAGRKHFNARMTSEREQWGFIPEEYMKVPESTPRDGDLYSGTAIPPDQIRKIMTAYRTEQPFHPDDRELVSVYGSITIGSTSRCERHRIRHCLLAYHRLFPESKWLTESDVKFLEDDEKDPYWTPAE